MCCIRCHDGSKCYGLYLYLYLHLDIMIRGGARQVARQVAAAQTGAGRDRPRGGGVPPEQRSRLVEALLFLFGWGLLSAPAVQWLAAVVVQDGCTHPDLVRLSTVGTSGQWAGNARRDLLRKFATGLDLAAFTILQLPCLISAEAMDVCNFFIMPPGRILNSMYLHYRSAFDFFIGVDPMRFWSAVNPNDPKFLNFQRLLGPVAEWGPRTIPLLIHADGAVFTKKSQRSILSFQWKSLLGNSFGLSFFRFLQ